MTSLHAGRRRHVSSVCLAIGAIAALPAIAHADPSPSPPAPQEPSPGPGVTMFRFVADRPGVRLYREGSDTPICFAPCNTHVDGSDGSDFYFAGPGVRDSRPFSLSLASGETRFRVETGDRTKSTVGLVLAITGGGAAAAGGFGFGATMASGAGSGEAVAAQLGSLIGGTVLAIAGGVLRQTNATTATRVGSVAPLAFTF